MFCTRCGEENKDTAVFCRKCGEPTGVETETRVAPRPASAAEYMPPQQNADPLIPKTAEQESTIFSITPTLLFVKAGYVATALAALFLVAIASAFAAAIVPVWLAVILGLLLFAVPGYYHLKQKLVRYTLTDSKLEIDSGLVSRNTRNIPIRRIQDVTISTNVFQRLLGFGDVVIDNASEEGGKVVLKNINSPREHADMMLKQMHRIER